MQRWKNKENTHFLKHYLHYLGTTGFGYFRLGEWKKKKSQSIKPQDFSCFSSLSSGADGTRTRDPRRDRPVFSPAELPHQNYFHHFKKAVRTGLEPATPGVTGLYSNQLNYRTFFHLCIKQPLLFSIASANVGRFFESANILSKKEKKFCRNYFVAVIRNSE